MKREEEANGKVGESEGVDILCHPTRQNNPR